MCAGSCGAIHGAKIAENTNSATRMTPIAASGLWRAMRGSEIVKVAKGFKLCFTYIEKVRDQQSRWQTSRCDAWSTLSKPDDYFPSNWLISRRMAEINHSDSRNFSRDPSSRV